MAATESTVGIRHVTVVPTNYDPAEESGESDDDGSADPDPIAER